MTAPGRVLLCWKTVLEKFAANVVHSPKTDFKLLHRSKIHCMRMLMQVNGALVIVQSGNAKLPSHL
jgi:hypothetical protein